MDIDAFQKKLRNFAKERDWEQFHTPKNLVMALTGEAGELTEIFQWMSEKQSFEVMKDDKLKVDLMDEMADVMIYLMRLADILGVDLEKACEIKFKKNVEKYPVHLAKGSAKKYTEYEVAD